ncbi:hypothetical protein PsorP6_014039 [Peronosclerospora sorghi]|uniref:Uncharacterized protein n=1 Tax=Peronosclerospora sorghi TaxID=230839 RepID=A0ACC0VGZ1_9STRA|nr:hypothetical protein PsorP6_014039 [Peronosclerospora sorghi]
MDDKFKKSFQNKNHDSLFENIGGLIFLKTKHKKKRLCAPNNKKLRLGIVHIFHDATSIAHPGILRTYMLVSQWSWWNNMQ